MIVKPTDSICVCCGEQIPEGRQVCLSCGASEGDFFQKAMSRIIPTAEKEFEVSDEIEQAYRQGFEAGMKNACEIKQENEKLKKHNAILMAAIERRAREDDVDSFYE